MQLTPSRFFSIYYSHSSIKTPLTDGRRLSQRYLPPASFCLLQHRTAQIHPASYLFGDNFHNDTPVHDIPFILMTHPMTHPIIKWSFYHPSNKSLCRILTRSNIKHGRQ